MKRIKKYSVLSIVFLSIGAFALPLMFLTGNLLPGIVAVLFLVLGFVVRKTESLDDYRKRYDQKYGTDDQ